MSDVKCQMSNVQSESFGFTLIEVLIVLGISVLLITTASLTLFSTKAVRDLQLTGQELSTQIQEIRTRSINQQDGKTWGILFINSPGDESDRYEVFSGPNYASGDVEREFWLQRNVRFIEPPSANNLEVSFDPITGRPNEVAEIILTNASGLEFGITINALGRITTEFDR